MSINHFDTIEVETPDKLLQDDSPHSIIEQNEVKLKQFLENTDEFNCKDDDSCNKSQALNVNVLPKLVSLTEIDS